MWYHSLNCGFTTRLSVETDSPCISDEPVGLVRSYFKPEGPMNYDSYVAAIKKGGSYVSDCNSHIIDFAVNKMETCTKDSKLSLNGKQTVKIAARVTANLSVQQAPRGLAIAQSPFTDLPYWVIERARIGQTRKVYVGLIVNGELLDSIEIKANGKWNDVSFSYPVNKSSWVAVRVYSSSHTNHVFVILDGKPIHDRRSAAWSRQAVDQCWKMKQGNIRMEERAAAEAVYNKARRVCEKTNQEASRK
jgi:hypothetical protein